MQTQKQFIRDMELRRKRDGWVGIGNTELRVCAIRITLNNGEIETLITNAGEERIKYEVFKELYHKRRGIETKYKRLKQRLELENFSGRLAGNIKQDFCAVMTAADIMAHFMRAANREVRKAREESGNQYEYRVNENHAAGVYKDRLIGVMIAKRRGERVRLMRELAAEIERRAVPIRPGREVPGKRYPVKPIFTITINQIVDEGVHLSC